jgi:hypothetical protein
VGSQAAYCQALDRGLMCSSGMQGLSAESLSNVTDEGDYKFEGTSQELDTACLRPSCTHSSTPNPKPNPLKPKTM